jgi:hypothetical protein
MNTHEKAISWIYRINLIVTDSCLNLCFHSSLLAFFKFHFGSQ